MNTELCHKIRAGLFNALFIRLMYGNVAQWLKFCAVNHDIMGSNPAKTVYVCSRIFYLIIFVVDFLHVFHVLYLFIITHYNARTT